MTNTPHNALVQALARIDQLVAKAQELGTNLQDNATLRLLAALKEIQLATEVAENAVRSRSENNS